MRREGPRRRRRDATCCAPSSKRSPTQHNTRTARVPSAVLLVDCPLQSAIEPDETHHWAEVPKPDAVTASHAQTSSHTHARTHSHARTHTRIHGRSYARTRERVKGVALPRLCWGAHCTIVARAPPRPALGVPVLGPSKSLTFATPLSSLLPALPRTSHPPPLSVRVCDTLIQLYLLLGTVVKAVHGFKAAHKIIKVPKKYHKNGKC